MRFALVLIALFSLPFTAQAAVWTEPEPIDVFCASYESDRFIKPADRLTKWPSEAPLELRQRLSVLDSLMEKHAMDAGFFNRAVFGEVTERYCSQYALTLRGPLSHIEKLKAHFGPRGVKFEKLSDAEPKPQMSAQGLALVTSHAQMMKHFAAVLFSKPDAHNLTAGVLYFEKQVKPILEGKHNVNGVMRELNRLVPESFAAKMKSEWELLTDYGRRHIMGELDADWNQTLKVAHSVHKNKPESKRKAAAFKQAVSNMVSTELKGLAEGPDFNLESREVLADGLVKTFDFLETRADEFTISEAINETIIHIKSFCIPKNDEPCFGLYTKRALERMLSYAGLDVYAVVLIRAILANQYSPSLVPDPETINLYRKMWREMPMFDPKVSVSNVGTGDNAPDLFKNRVEIRGPYRFFTTMSGKTPVSVVEGLQYIDNWFSAHHVPTVVWGDQRGISREQALQNSDSSPLDAAVGSTEVPCVDLLNEFLERRRLKGD